MIRLGEGRYGVLFEAGPKSGGRYDRIFFVPFTQEDVIK